MAKKNINKQLNIDCPYNLYSWGGDFMNSFMPSGPVFSGANVGNMAKGVAGPLGGIIGQGLNSAVSGGLNSGAGNAISGLGSTIGGAVSAVNPLVGGAISLGSGLVGGLVNAAFGSKLNKENIKGIENDNLGMNTIKVNYDDADSLLNQYNNQNFGVDFNRRYVGKDGWFSHKAKRKYNTLKNEQEAARNRAYFTYGNAVDNLDFNNDLDAQFNYAALGGPLNTDFTNGVTKINEGNSHELNPNMGVQIGKDKAGKPNLVEEGETLFNNYVFSDRLKVPEEFKIKNKLNKNINSFSDAAKKLSKESEERPNDPISKLGLDISLERLMASQEGVKERMEAENQFKNRMENINKFATGGNYDVPDKPIWSTKIKVDSYNPNGIVYNSDGTINWDETYKEGSDYMNLRQYYIDNWDKESFKGLKERFLKNLSVNNDKKDFSKVTLDDFKRLTLDKKLGRFHNLNIDDLATSIKLNDLKLMPLIDELDPESFKEGPINIPFAPMDIERDKSNPKLRPTWMRYAPIVGSALALGHDLFNKPDYSNAERIEQEAERSGGYNPISFNPIGNYLTYNPFDRDFYSNKLASQAQATRQAIINNSNGNRATATAGLLAADMNAQSQLGDLFRKAEEFNMDQRHKVENFNRGTNMFNSEGIFKADSANQNADLNSRRNRMSGMAQAAAMRDNIEARRGASISANLTNLFNSIGNIGTDNYNKNSLDMLIRSGVFGTLGERPQTFTKNKYTKYLKGLEG